MHLRLLLADDNEVVRSAVRGVLGRKRGWEVCGEAANGKEAVAKFLQLAPDVVILDLAMPEMNGYEAAAEIRKTSPRTMIVFLSQYEVPLTAAELGGDAFISKSATVQRLIPEIETVVLQARRHQAAAPESGQTR